MSTSSGKLGGPLKLVWQRLHQETLKNLHAACQKYNEDMVVKVDLFHCMRQFTSLPAPSTAQTAIFHWFSTPSAVTVKEQTSEEFLLDAGNYIIHTTVNVCNLSASYMHTKHKYFI